MLDRITCTNLLLYEFSTGQSSIAAMCAQLSIKVHHNKTDVAPCCDKIIIVKSCILQTAASSFHIHPTIVNT